MYMCIYMFVRLIHFCCFLPVYVTTKLRGKSKEQEGIIKPRIISVVTPDSRGLSSLFLLVLFPPWKARAHPCDIKQRHSSGSTHGLSIPVSGALLSTCVTLPLKRRNMERRAPRAVGRALPPPPARSCSNSVKVYPCFFTLLFLD